MNSEHDTKYNVVYVLCSVHRHSFSQLEFCFAGNNSFRSFGCMRLMQQSAVFTLLSVRRIDAGKSYRHTFSTLNIHYALRLWMREINSQTVNASFNSSSSNIKNECIPIVPGAMPYAFVHFYFFLTWNCGVFDAIIVLSIFFFTRLRLDWILGRGHSARLYCRRYFIGCYCSGRKFS